MLRDLGRRFVLIEQWEDVVSWALLPTQLLYKGSPPSLFTLNLCFYALSRTMHFALN